MHFLWQSGSGKIADENLHGGCGLHHRRATKYIYKTAGEASETRNADPEVQVLQEETIHEVQKLVQQLPEKYRLVVYLYYSADMKLTEIAECLHLSVNTVKTRLRKAKSLLKEKLEVIGYER